MSKVIQMDLFQELKIRSYKQLREIMYKGLKERANKRREAFLNNNYEDISILLPNKNISNGN